MSNCITMTVPARVDVLNVVRLTTAGIAVSGQTDFETMEDIKTAVYEACYAMSVQKYAPERLELCFKLDGAFHVTITGQGRLRETDGRMPDLDLCNAVLTTMIENVSVNVDRKGIRSIEMHA